MYRFNSLNADIQLIVDGALANNQMKKDYWNLKYISLQLKLRLAYM